MTQPKASILSFLVKVLFASSDKKSSAKRSTSDAYSSRPDELSTVSSTPTNLNLNAQSLTSH